MKIKLKMQILAGLVFAGCVMHMLVEPSKTKRRPIAPFVVEEINPDDTCMICQQDAQERVKEGRLYRTDCCHNFLCEEDLNELLQNYSNTLDTLHNIRKNPLTQQDYIDRAMRNNELLSDPMVKWLTEDIEPVLTCPACRAPLSTHQAKLQVSPSDVLSLPSVTLPPRATARYDELEPSAFNRPSRASADYYDEDAWLQAAIEASRQSFEPEQQRHIATVPPQATARSQSPVSRAGRPSGQAVSYRDEDAMLQAALEASLLTEQPRVRPEDELQVAIAESLRVHAAEQKQRQALSRVEFLPKAPVSRFEYARSLAGQPKVILVPPQQVSRQVFVNPKATSLEEVD